MPLQLPPGKYTQLYELVTKYNSISEDDKIQRLFYLQKINYVLNTLEYDGDLFKWFHSQDEDGWSANLSPHGINPYGSFFIKTYQFAKAVSNALRKSDIEHFREMADIDKNAEHHNPIIEQNLQFEIMQNRDSLFEDNSATFDECQTAYKKFSYQLNDIRENNSDVNQRFINQLEILNLAKAKINSIINPATITEKSLSERIYKWVRNQAYSLMGLFGYKIKRGYQTELLGEAVNNHNFKFIMPGKDETFIFRVESRDNWEDEQQLQKHVVAKLFIEDYAGFTMAFKNQNDETVYQPVVLSQFARQGNLRNIAKEQRSEKPSRYSPIPTKVEHYLQKMIYICNELVKSKHYHPDIKLTNFLADNNSVRISDRKTIIKEEKPFAYQIFSSPLYAPPEYVDCVRPDLTGFNYKAYGTKIDMNAFMAYQLGMALKEFLILSQLETFPDDEEFRNPDNNVASYYESPSNAIENLSLLIQELTRKDPQKRLKIDQLRSLLIFKNIPTEMFYKELEKRFPSHDLGIDEDIDEISKLIESDLTDTDLLTAANTIFNKIDKMEPKEHRLSRMAEKLAAICFHKCSQTFFKPYADAIDELMIQKAKYDWEQASWYRKLLHVSSFGLFPVKESEISDYLDIHKIDLPVNTKEFQLNFHQMNFIQMKELRKIFGNDKADNLARYMLGHISEIMAVSSDIEHLSENSESTANSVVMNDTAGTVIVNDTAGTVIVNDTAGTMIVDDTAGTMIVDDTAGTMIVDDTAGTMIVDDTAGTMIVDDTAGTMVMKNTEGSKKTKPSASKPNVSELSMFHTEITPQREINRVDSYRRTMFRGDGSVRGLNMPQHNRPKLSRFTFHPTDSSHSLGTIKDYSL